MAEVFGRVKDSEVQNGKLHTTFTIPGFSQSIVRQRARANARLKEYSNFEVDTVENVDSGSLPGQSVYEVLVVSDR